jgi:hypothetical protein
MGTDVRIAAVAAGVLWGRSHRDARPESLPVTELAIVVIDDALEAPVVLQRDLLAGRELTRATDHLLELDLPLVAFNALRFDWVALDTLVDVDPLITRTIDLHSALLPCVAEIVAAEGASAFPRSGSYGVLHPHRIAETNLGHPPAEEGPLGEALLAAQLWRRFVTGERAIAAGRSHVLSDDSVALLRGERPAFTDAAAWRAMLAERPEPVPYRRRTRHPVTFPRLDQRYV